MSGSRRKALKMAFYQQFGRTPNGPEIVTKEGDIVGYRPSEMRRLKKLYMSARRRGVQLT